MIPPPYPRTPYLADDPVPFLGVPLRVEEKLDGANVVLWLDGRRLRTASRGGPDAMDRANQLGRLRAWVAERDHVLRELCRNGSAVYAEWLWLRHGVKYDQLPAWLVVLDLWTASTGNVAVDERDARARAAGLPVPPLVVDRAVLRSADDAAALIPTSAWGSEPAEGLVLRRSDGRRCKVVRSGFEQRSNSSWTGEVLHNALG